MLGNIGQENVFYDILEQKKNPFQTTKTKSSKSQKIDILPKGLTHGFGPEMAIFPTFFFSQYRPGKCLLLYSRTKKTPFYAIKTRTLKIAKLPLFQRG